MPKSVSILESGQHLLLWSQDQSPLEKPKAAYPGQNFQDLIPFEYNACEIKSDKYTLPSTSVYLVSYKNAYLCIGPGIDGVVFTEDFSLVHETSFFSSNVGLYDEETLKIRAVQLDFPIFSSVDCVWLNYYHWLIYGIGKSELASSFISEDCIMAFPDYTSETRLGWGHRFSHTVWKQSLRSLRPPRQLLILPDGVYRVPNLSLIWTNHANPPYISLAEIFYSGFNRIRKRHYSCKPSIERILIRRRNNPRISQKDSENLYKIASGYGFVVVDLDELGFDSQVTLFSSAKKVIAPHGAGLANLLFASSDLSVLELNSFLEGETRLRPWFYLRAC